MGLARVRKPEGLVSREARSIARSENAIRKCDSNRHDSQVRSTSAIQKCDQEVRLRSTIQKCDQEVRLTSAINRCESQMRSTGATHKCDQQVRLTSAIDRCDSQVRSTGATHKCDRLNRESKKFEVCKFASLKRLESSQVHKFALKKNTKIQKTLLNESGQFDNECSTINWCLRVVGTLRLLI